VRALIHASVLALLTSPPGNVTGVGSCFASGTGSAVVSDGTMSGNLGDQRIVPCGRHAREIS
jgi:hypothetical protein